MLPRHIAQSCSLWQASPRSASGVHRGSSWLGTERSFRPRATRRRNSGMAAESQAGGAIGHWIEQNLGAGKVTAEKYMGQSSWATSHRYETDSGKRFFVKMARGQDGSMFKGEALGLQAMYDTHTLRIPKIYHHGELSTLPEARNEHGSFIIMEFLDFGGGRSDAHELGAGLAKMHLAKPVDERAQQGQFGFAVDNTIGGTHQANGWMPSWVEFVREQRLKPLLQQAQKPSLSQMGDVLCRNLDKFFEGVEVRPSLLHGDLWSGNMTTVKEGGWAILDPAVYYGHHEAEFGMSWCAGFSGSFWEGYRSVIPEDPGGYGSQCESILRGLTRNLK